MLTDVFTTVEDIHGFKAFTAGMMCKNDFQYASNQTYKMEGDPIMCVRGFHFCELSVDVLPYCDNNAVFARVTAPKGASVMRDNDKTVTNEIKIGANLTYNELLSCMPDGEIIRPNGEREWYRNGLRHRDDDLPAMKRYCGTLIWFKNGLIHRENGQPAVIRASGTCEWHKNGQFHRDDDLPAIERSDGVREWIRNGMRHREGDLPAIERPKAGREWFKNNLRHREGGLPAIERSDGTREYYINGKHINT